jgi:hypothetical protein
MTAAAEYDDIWDSVWHGCVWAAYFDQMAEEGGPPSSEATRRRAYAYYEEELRKKDAAKATPSAGSPRCG